MHQRAKNNVQNIKSMKNIATMYCYADGDTTIIANSYSSTEHMGVESCGFGRRLVT